MIGLQKEQCPGFVLHQEIGDLFPKDCLCSLGVAERLFNGLQKKNQRSEALLAVDYVEPSVFVGLDSLAITLQPNDRRHKMRGAFRLAPQF